MSEPLEQFMQWYDGYVRNRAASGLADSEYSLARAAFYGGYDAKPQPSREPSRNALDTPSTVRPRPFMEHNRKTVQHLPAAQPRMMPAPVPPPATNPTNPQPVLPADYAGPSEETLRRVQGRVDPEKTARLAAAYGATDFTGPDGSSLQQVELAVTDRARAISRNIDDSMDHIERVWEEDHYGAPGPVPTVYGIQSDYDSEFWSQ